MNAARVNNVSTIGLSLNAVIPVMCVALAGLACLLAEAFREKGERMPIGGLGLIGLGGAAVSSLLLWGRHTTSFGVVAADSLGLFVYLILIAVGVLTIVHSWPLLERDGLPAGEYYALLLFALAGMMLMASATDLLVMFVSLEVLSLAVYVLTGIRRNALASTEGAFKYFLLGGFSSAFFLYGVAFAFGLSGTTRLDAVGRAAAQGAAEGNPLWLVAMGLMLVGFGFKVAAVPFHMWTPDAYEGAPSIVTGFMSTAVKAAAFAAFIRVFVGALAPLQGYWVPVVWGLALCTMILGSIVGVLQENVKRMLAYSSIAHGGYLLVALTTADEVGVSAILFYLVVYAVTNLAAFALVAHLGSEQEPRESVRDFAGLWYSRPVPAVLLAIFLLSLGGFPPMAGFVAKWYVFSAAVRAGEFTLAIVGVLTSVVSVFFYMRLVVQMFMTEKAEAPAPAPLPAAAVTALVLSAAALFVLGLLPAPLMTIASATARILF
jgi:NADH-quinone oxidoreductase subunit N